MKEIEELRQDLLDRYNQSWEEAHVTDDMGLIQACKENFEQLLDKLIEKARKYGV